MEYSLWQVSSSATFHFHMTFWQTWPEARVVLLVPRPHRRLTGLDTSRPAYLLFYLLSVNNLDSASPGTLLACKIHLCVFTVAFYKARHV